MTAQLAGRLARQLDAAAFAVTMLGLCWWLHAAIAVLAWLSRRPGAPLALVAVEGLAVLLVALGVPVLGGRPVFRLLCAVLRRSVWIVLSVEWRLSRRPASGAGRRVSGGVR